MNNPLGAYQNMGGYQPYLTYGYGSYMPSYMRNPMMQPAVPNPNPSSPTNGIEWAMGIENAKSVIVEPGKSKIIMDSEQPKFYIKTVDMNGMGSIKAFTFQEDVAPQATPAAAAPSIDMGKYVTKDELQTILTAFKESVVASQASPQQHAPEQPKTLI